MKYPVPTVWLVLFFSIPTDFLRYVITPLLQVCMWWSERFHFLNWYNIIHTNFAVIMIERFLHQDYDLGASMKKLINAREDLAWMWYAYCVIISDPAYTTNSSSSANQKHYLFKNALYFVNMFLFFYSTRGVGPLFYPKRIIIIKIKVNL